MRLVESWVRRPSLREIIGLGLFFNLRLVKEHAIVYMDAFSISSLRVGGILYISQARGFL